jgi:hypothetical protein
LLILYIYIERECTHTLIEVLILHIISLNPCISYLLTKLTSKYWTCNWSLFQSQIICRKIIFLSTLLKMLSIRGFNELDLISDWLYPRPLNSKFCFTFFFLFYPCCRVLLFLVTVILISVTSLFFLFVLFFCSIARLVI